MASKKETHQLVVAAIAAVCKANKLNEKVTAELNEVLDVHLAPKAGGATVNIDEVTKKDKDGKIVEIQCSVSGKFLPATPEYFYEEKVEGKGINGLKRLSRQAEAVRKQFIKVNTASEKAIMADVISKKITPEAGQELLTKLAAAKPDFSKVGIIVPKPAEEDVK